MKSTAIEPAVNSGLISNDRFRRASRPKRPKPMAGRFNIVIVDCGDFAKRPVAVRLRQALKHLKRTWGLGCESIVEAIEKPKAEERKDAARPPGGRAGGGKLPPPETSGKTRDKVAEALGVSGEASPT